MVNGFTNMTIDRPPTCTTTTTTTTTIDELSVATPPVVLSKRDTRPAPSSVSTCPETPGSPDDHGSLNLTAVSGITKVDDDDNDNDYSVATSYYSDGGGSSKKLETPPRLTSTSRNNITLLNQMQDSFPSPDDERCLPARSRTKHSSPSSPSAASGNNTSDYIKPNTLFSEEEEEEDTQEPPKMTTSPSSKETPPETTPEQDEQPGKIVSRKKDDIIINNASYQQDRLVLADDASWCSSNVPFDCKEDYRNESITISKEEGLSLVSSDIPSSIEAVHTGFHPTALRLFRACFSSSRPKPQAEDLSKTIGNPLQSFGGSSFRRGYNDDDNKKDEDDADKDAEMGTFSSYPNGRPPKDNHNAGASGDDWEDDDSSTGSESGGPDKVPPPPPPPLQRRARSWKETIFYSAVGGILVVITVIAIMLLLGNSGKSSKDNTPDKVVPDDTFPNSGDLKLVNELCPKTIRIEEGGTEHALYGSTMESEWDTTIDMCGDQMSIGYGVWHLYEPESSQLMEASTCDGADFDTQITIMSGDCGTMTCVNSNDNDNACGDQSQATWFAEAGKSYYILVHGFREAQGTFALSLAPAPTNGDECPTAMGPVAVGSISFGTTKGVTHDAVDQCGDVVSNLKPGIWYALENVEGWLRAQVIDKTYGFGGQVSVYRGGCDAMVCETGSREGSVSWKAEAASTYYLFVNGMNQPGDFDLYVGYDWEDTCDNAIPVLPSSVAFVASTSQSRPQTVQSCGFLGTHTAPGMWMTVAGTGKLLEATACSSETDLDTQISVFRGGCDELECVGGTGQGLPCGNDGIVTWATNPDENYLLFISGRASRIGEFWLTVDEASARGGADCSQSVSLASKGALIIGSTVDATKASDVCGDVDISRGVWYKVQGNGNTISVSTCGPDTDFDARISMFTGTCGALNCAAHTTSDCAGGDGSLRWATDRGSTYYLLVHGQDDFSLGNFVLTLEEESLNDSCGDAIEIEGRSNTYFGSNVNAQLSDARGCGNEKTRGLWYKLIGTGGEVTVSTCSSQTDFDTEISVFSGSSCAEMSCVQTATDGCGIQAELAFGTTSGVEYFFRVRGQNPKDVGNFMMTVSLRSPFFGNW